ncbi:MAG: hypothetical protein IPP33_11325 [Flavobacteriales bacterium]|nr:hypothetical protein [Flavobacteriales bacterium]
MRYSLRFLLAASFVASFLPDASAQNTGINTTGAAPAARALLDVDVSGLPANGKRGMLIPRMTAAQRTAIVGLTAVDKGLWVYQTDDATNALTVADPTLLAKYKSGFFYYEGISPAPDDWVRYSSAGSSWMVAGNGNTAAATHYLGTNTGSLDDFHIRTVNTGAQPQVLVSATNGFVGVNPIAAPVERLDVNGGVRVGNTLLNTAGAIKYENTLLTPNRWHFGNLNGTATGWQRLENAEVEYTNQAYRPIANQCLNVDGQVVRGTLGTVTDAVGAGQNPNTPFNTNTGPGNLRKGHHVQYLYPASELLAAGLCQGRISAVSMYVLGTDPNGAPGADMKIEIRMKHTALNTFLANNWEPTALWGTGAGSYTPCNSDSLISFLAQPGWKQWNFEPSCFVWDGVQNVVIDLCWYKSPTIGTSPKVNLEVGLPYQATKWVTWTVGNDPTDRHGRTYRDNPLSVGAAVGTTNNRPVTRFNGKVQTPGYVGADVLDNFINYGGGLIVDSATVSPGVWADANYRGPGTVRARVAVFDGSIQLSDHVFDTYFDGNSKPAANDKGYSYVSVDDLKDYLKTERHLPSMPSREEWETYGSKSLGELQTGLWETVETQALNIVELEKDLSAMETLAFGSSASEEELRSLIDEVNASRRLSDAQKLHLTGALHQRIGANTQTK